MKKRAQSLGRLILAQDWLAVLLAAILLGTGLSFIYSASWRGEEMGIVGSWFRRQIWWAALGTVLATALAAVDYRFWIRTAWWLYLATLGMLALVLVMGTKVYGAYRWLNVFGVLVQPSEFAKVALLSEMIGGAVSLTEEQTKSEAEDLRARYGQKA